MPRLRFAWLEKKVDSRFVTQDSMRVGDIAMKVSDGRLFMVGSGGQIDFRNRRERLRDWFRRHFA